MPTVCLTQDLVVRHHTSLRDIPPTQWDGLAGDEVLWRHGWLYPMESQGRPGRKPWYLVVEHGGRIVAAAAGATLDNAAGSGLERRLFGRGAGVVRALGGRLSPVLSVGARMGIAPPICVRPDCPPEQARHLVNLVLEHLKDAATRERRTLVIEGVATGSWLEPLFTAHGLQRTPEVPTTTMNVAWTDFTGYLASLGRAHPSMPGNIRNERSRARRAGVTIERLSRPGAHSPALHSLLEAHSRRLNRIPSPFVPGSLDQLAEQLGERLVLNVAFRHGQPIGVMVGLMSPDTLYVLQVGMDEAHQRETLAYFVLVYDASIELALQHGVTQIVGGRLAYAVKRRRGFHLQPTHTYLKPRHRWHAAILAGAALATSHRIRAMTGAGA